MQYEKSGLRVLAMVAAFGMIVAACGDTAVPLLQVEDKEVAMPSKAVDEGFDLVTAPHTTVVSTSEASQPTVVPDPIITTKLVSSTGESFDDPFGPMAGEEVGVIGVAFDDVLNVRAGPGVDEQIVATLDSLAFVAGTGRHQQLTGGAIWWEVIAGDTSGWAHSSYLSRFGEPVALPGLDATLTAASLADLGRAVVEDHMSGLDPSSDVTMTLAPRGEHDLGEVVFDITGSGDDSVSGYRLHVYARPTDDRQAFQLVGVEVTTMCWRGVHRGVCV